MWRYFATSKDSKDWHMVGRPSCLCSPPASSSELDSCTSLSDLSSEARADQSSQGTSWLFYALLAQAACFQLHLSHLRRHLGITGKETITDVRQAIARGTFLLRYTLRSVLVKSKPCIKKLRAENRATSQNVIQEVRAHTHTLSQLTWVIATRDSLSRSLHAKVAIAFDVSRRIGPYCPLCDVHPCTAGIVA